MLSVFIITTIIIILEKSSSMTEIPRAKKMSVNIALPVSSFHCQETDSLPLFYFIFLYSHYQG